MDSEELFLGTNERFLCHKCVGEPYLSNEIKGKGRQGLCSNCGKKETGVPIVVLATRIGEVFAEHYTKTLNVPNPLQQSLLSDRESGYDWERDGEPVTCAIMDVAQISEDVANEIQAILEEEHGDMDAWQAGEETEFHSDSYYEEREVDDEAWQQEWLSFEDSLKNQSRFFDSTSVEFLSRVFEGVHDMTTMDLDPVVKKAGPGTSLIAVYRARVFQSDAQLMAALCSPVQYLGPPLPKQAKGGQMNAHGISVFYGACTKRVAIAEVRPPVGSQVVVARFEVIRNLRLLDFTAVAKVLERGSLFDPDSARRRERAKFLRFLAERISRPVMPDDEELDYLPTQALADFLTTKLEPRVDGILFPSVQSKDDAANLVLFHEAALVERMEMPHGTIICASITQYNDEFWEKEYEVEELVPPQQGEINTSIGSTPPLDIGGFVDTQFSPPELFPDCREPASRIDIESIEVHLVDSVEVLSKRHGVRRYRREKDEWD